MSVFRSCPHKDLVVYMGSLHIEGWEDARSFVQLRTPISVDLLHSYCLYPIACFTCLRAGCIGICLAAGGSLLL